MKTNSTNCSAWTKGISKDLASGIKMYLMLFLFVAVGGFTASAQNGLPSVNITGPLSACIQDSIVPQRLNIKVYSLVRPDSIAFSISYLQGPPCPSLDAAQLAAIDLAGNTAFTLDPVNLNPPLTPSHTWSLNLPLDFFGGACTGAFAINVQVFNSFGNNVASKSVTIQAQKDSLYADTMLCYHGTTTLHAFASPAPLSSDFCYLYTYYDWNAGSVDPDNGEWLPGPVLGTATICDNTVANFNNVPAGTYLVTVQTLFGGQVDPAFCTGWDTIRITQPLDTPTVLTCPQPRTVPACQTQADIDAAYADWLSTVIATGGKHYGIYQPVLTDNHHGAPSYCGGSDEVTWTFKDTCYGIKTCSSTFTVTQPDPLQITCPEPYTALSCQTQGDVDLAYRNWLGTAIGGGGCGGYLTNDGQGAPNYCGGSTTVTFTYHSTCYPYETTCSSTFSVTYPDQLSITCPEPSTQPSCQLQSDIDAAFTAWLGTASARGGCNGQLTDDHGAAPNYCGGSTTVTFTYTSSCYPYTTTCSSTFSVTEPQPLSITCPEPSTQPSCQLQSDIDAAFTAWLGTASARGGCNGQLTDDHGAAPNYCGGSTTVTFTYTSSCYPYTTTCSSTFSVTEPDPLSITCPEPSTQPSCQLQSDIDAAFTAWLGTASAGGGCNGQLTDDHGAAPSYCGGSTTVTFTYTSSCYPYTTTCSSTFSVTEPDPLSITCPEPSTQPSCQLQSDIDAAFTAWLGTASARGGCNGQLTDDHGAAPSYCGGSTTVTFTYSSSCYPYTTTCSSTFSVTEPQPLSITCPEPSTQPSCQLQSDIDAAFTAWLGTASARGGCNGQLTDDHGAAPSYCGGSTTVTFTYTSSCYPYTTTCSSTFTVTEPTPLTITCPEPATLAACQTQADINAAFAAWLATASGSGGCVNPAIVLYDQTDNHSNFAAVSSQNFEPANDAFDTEGADDFIVPGGQTWNITQVNAPGTYFNGSGPLTSVNVTFYTDAPGLPNLIVHQDLYVPAIDASGSLTINLPSAVTLSTGHYWVAVQANMDFSSGGQWGWDERSVQSNDESAWRNPGAGFGTPCTNWGPRTSSCGVTAGGGADFVFSLTGTNGNGVGGAGLTNNNQGAPSACGGSTDVTFTYTSSCYPYTTTCSSTFTVTEPTPMQITCPAVYTADACQTQDDIDNAFIAWVNSVTFSGGCDNGWNAFFANGGTWPDVCGSSTDVRFEYYSTCYPYITTCLSTFNVTYPDPLSITCPEPSTQPSCQLQSDIDAAFTAWLGTASARGGCNGQLTDDHGAAPNYCGGSTTVTFTYTSSCYPYTTTCSSTFSVTEPDQLSITCPEPSTQPSCQLQSDIDAAFTAWLGTASARGGCNGQLTDDHGAAPSYCGGSTTVTFTYTSSCYPYTTTCSSTFSVTEPDPLSITCPEPSTQPSCQLQSDIDAAFTAWLGTASAGGGCNGQLTDDHGAAPSYCGGSTTVTFTYTSSCYPYTTTCSSTFSVTEPDPLSITCPEPSTQPSCQLQSDIDAAFTAWLGTASARGGCNGQLTDDHGAAPSYCGGSTTVTFTYSSSCYPYTTTCSSTFSVTEPQPLSITCPEPSTQPSCQLQSDIDAAFTAWLGTASARGGCNGQLTDDHGAAPNYCGGSTTVTFTYTSSCYPYTTTCSSTFTVTEPTPLTITCPEPATLAACQTQADINAAFAAWLATASGSGGCVNPAIVLYDQTDNHSNFAAVSSQNFEPANDAFDTEGADDFIVPGGQTWNITQVNAPGTYFNGSGPLTSVNVTFYTDAPGLPNLIVHQDLYVPAIDASGSLTINLPSAVTLSTGHYWVAVQANMDFSSGGQWGWDERSVQSNDESAWRNPGAGFGTPCTNWGPRTSSCGVTAGGGADFVFSLTGTNGNGVGGAGLTNNNQGAPSACGGSTDVTFTYTSSCYPYTTTCSSTFTVTEPTPMQITCPAVYTADACQTQDDIDNAFIAWVNSVTFSGGCDNGWNAFFANGGTWPDVCGSSTDVRFEYYSTCYPYITTCLSTFNVTYPDPLSITCPEPSTQPSCQLQSDIDAAFTAWLGTASARGGCNGQLTDDHGAAPNYCGGSTTVTFTYTSSCYPYTTTCSSTFSVTEPDQLSITCPEPSTQPSCQLQSDIDAAFTAWLGTASARGGCNGQLTDDHGAAPSYCGGSTTVTFTYTSSCYPYTTTCSSTFSVTEPDPLSITCPEPSTQPSCQLQSDIDAAFTAWLGTASAGGGCNGQLTDDHGAAPSYCGGSTTVTFTYTSSCYPYTTTCSSTFSVTEPDPLSITCPEPSTQPSCQLQSDIDAAFTAWLGTASARGGCNGQLTDDHGAAPSYCGGSTTVTFTYSSSCYPYTTTCSSTFSVTEPQPLSITCPEPSTQPSCQLQSDIDAAFTAWLGTASARGGCNGQLTDDHGAAPNYCGGSTTVTFTYTSSCYPYTTTCSSTFSVSEPTPLSITCPEASTQPSCQLQSDIDAAFTAWLGTASARGGCNGQLTDDHGAAPSYCGGSTTVTFTYTSSCYPYTTTCSSTFTVTPPSDLHITCPSDLAVDACQTQADVNAEFTAWLGSVTAGGGCNGQLSDNHEGYPSVCGGSTTVTFTYTSSCYPYTTTCAATFSVRTATFTAPGDITIYTDAVCGYDASPVITGTPVTGGSCSATYTDVLIEPRCSHINECSCVCDPGSCPGSKSIIRTWHFTDYCQNQYPDQTQNIFIRDTTPPTFTRPADITIYWDANCEADVDPALTGDVTDEHDNCTQCLQASYTDRLRFSLCNFTVTRTWTLSDRCGNAAAPQVQIITVRDNTPPVITCSPDKTVACNAPVSFDPPTASDACGAAPTVTILISENVVGNVHTRTWIATDACGNTATCSQSVTVNGGGQLTMTACTHTNPACQGGTGSVSAGTVSGSYGQLTYTWTNCSTGALVGSTPTVSGLLAGTYCLTVTDACSSASCTQTITQPTTVMTMGTCSHTNPNCNGGNGSVTAGAISNANGTVYYSWTNASNVVVGTTATVSNLPAGTYYLTVHDNCTTLTCNQCITQPNAMTMGSCSHTNCPCGGTGSVTAGAIANANGPIVYSWKNAANNVVGTTATVSNLAAGTYTLTVHDNCTTLTCSQTITGSTSTLAMGPCSHTNPGCNQSCGGGNTTGSVSAGTITGASGTVHYSWKNSSNTVVGTTATVTGLPAGTYTLTVTDNCGTVTCSQTITQPTALTLGTCSHTNATCANPNGGSVTAGTVTGGSGTITYKWRNASNTIVGTTATVTGLPAGTYTLTVQDNCSSLTCSQCITGSSSNLAMGTCSHTNVSCNGTGGSVSAGSVTGASGTVHYSWKNASNTVVGTTATVTGLPAGTYTLTVSDDCTSVTCSQCITGTSSNLAMGSCSHTNLGCNPSCGGGNTSGSVSAGTVTGASGTVTYKWRNSSNTIVGTTATVTGLPAGTYTLTVQDACTSVTCSQTITQPAALTLGSCSHTNATCNASNGSVTAGTVTGGSGTITYKWRNASNVIVGTTATVSNLPAGTYTLTVQDNCSSLTCCQTITGGNSGISCSITSNPTGGCSSTGGNPNNIYLGYGPQTTKLTVSVSGSGTFTYAWTPSAGLSCTNCAQPTFTPTAAGNYTFTVTVTSCYGCTSTCNITICVLDIRVPRGQCGNTNSVYICHLVSGHTYQTTYMSAGSVANYLACHPNDRLGSCNQVCGNAKTDEGDAPELTTDNSGIGFDLVVYPNPFSSQFHIRIESGSTERIDVKVFDILGQTLITREGISSNEDVQLGSEFASGTYLVEVKQGDKTKVIRLSKTQ